MITTIGLGLLAGVLLGAGYLQGDLDLVLGGLMMTGIAIVAGAIWALRGSDGKRRRW